MLRGLLRRRGDGRQTTCPSCGTPMGRREIACPEACGYDRRTEQAVTGSRWARLDRR